ncbi:MAG: serine hydrolase domain-containing protein [Halodesulfovibrio sp.]|uniref:serine hydrolase domain-containing protein n=1 Tax=Halodesulfovibrio sp. TaxID=1912772 RepID=UPI00359D2DCA
MKSFVNAKNPYVYLLCLCALMVGAMLFLFSTVAGANAATATQDKYATASELELMEGFPPPPDKRVTRDNAMLTAPFNRWSYLNMRMLYPSASIKAAEKAIAIKKEINKGLDTVVVEEPGSDSMVDMATFMKKTYTDSLVVIQGDKIVYEKFFNGMNANQPHQMMSVTKSFGGLLGLIAVEDGKLGEDDLVVEYIPELKDAGAFADATFGQALNMTNSMDFSEVYSDPKSGIRRYSAVLGWTAPEPEVEYEENLYEYIGTLGIDKKHKHGEIFHYQTPKTDVVNWVINRVNEQPFQDIMYDKLWSKLGTEGETYVLLDKNGTLVVGGGLNATPNNLARFAIMMINGGKFDGKQVVSPSVIKKLAGGGTIEAFDTGPESDGVVFPKGEWSYRAQWWVKHTKGMEAIVAIGVHGQWIYLDVNHKIAIIKQSSQPLSKDEYLNGFDLNAFYAIINYLSKK